MIRNKIKITRWELVSVLLTIMTASMIVVYLIWNMEAPGDLRDFVVLPEGMEVLGAKISKDKKNWDSFYLDNNTFEKELEEHARLAKKHSLVTKIYFLVNTRGFVVKRSILLVTNRAEYESVYYSKLPYILPQNWDDNFSYHVDKFRYDAGSSKLELEYNFSFTFLCKLALLFSLNAIIVSILVLLYLRKVVFQNKSEQTSIT